VVFFFNKLACVIVMMIRLVDYHINDMFGSVIATAFQSTFLLEMHQNNIFFIFLKLFLTLAHQNNLKT
jgi:hypothetical protein